MSWLSGVTAMLPTDCGNLANISALTGVSSPACAAVIMLAANATIGNVPLFTFFLLVLCQSSAAICRSKVGFGFRARVALQGSALQEGRCALIWSLTITHNIVR